MNNCPWDKPSRRIGAPGNWDHAVSGICHTIEIVDTPAEGLGNVMYSVWTPTAEEVARILDGQPIMLGIVGTVHPVITLSVPVSIPVGTES